MPITLADRQLIVARMDKQFNEGKNYLRIFIDFFRPGNAQKLDENGEKSKANCK